MKKKYYTIGEVRAVLPEVKRTVFKIRRALDRRDERQKTHAALTAAIAGNGGQFPSDRMAALQNEIARSERLVERLVMDIQKKFHCEIKGLYPILVDFHSLREDREVYLCWKEGEEEIAHWHDLDAGFAGRQPL